ncbi:GntR family transcriptional regulator [Alteromonadaceae bacterium Bs31]|nr:GntR family transcriptional regulator [Alteromonadaceae bacterium Bs31]
MMQFDSRKGALYQQLADYLVFGVLKGQLSAGDKLPSARELAMEVGLNPNTVIQAFQELERRGISETQRGKGTFVRQDIDTKQLRHERVARVTQDYLGEIKALGLELEDGLRALKESKKHDC